jgi:hypothetical protein
LLDALDVCADLLEKPHAHPDADSFTQEDFRPVTDFLFNHFIKGQEIAFNGNITSLFDYLSGDAIFHQLEKFFAPSKKPLEETLLSALLPTIKELRLYSKVIYAFRSRNICFEGDAKFWEIFIREVLFQFLQAQFLDTTGKPSSAMLATARNEHVEKMLAMDAPALMNYLSDVSKNAPPCEEWVPVDRDSLMKSVIINTSVPQLRERIIDDYL